MEQSPTCRRGQIVAFGALANVIFVPATVLRVATLNTLKTIGPFGIRQVFHAGFIVRKISLEFE
jgi:hypothetical protein